MNKYSEIETKTAKNLLKNGFKWIARNESGKLFVHSAKPNKGNRIWWSDGYISQVCGEFVPIFQNVKFEDSEPVSLEAIVHPQILDDAEKRYLSAVIRPFRDSIRCISKRSLGNIENILIFYDATAAGYEKYIELPYFKKGTMYKGMESNRDYTLEDLGL